MSLHYQVTFDAADPSALAAFWGIALDMVPQPPPPGYETWDAFADAHDMPESERDKYGAIIDPGDPSNRVLFIKVPESKTAKNRVHLDVHVSGGDDLPPEERMARIETHVAKLVAAGATETGRHEEFGSAWVVMADPEGNEFCVV